MGFRVDMIARVGDWLTDWFGSTSTFDLDCVVDETSEVEFVGGPLDGMLREVPSSELWQLPVVVEIPFCREQLDLLAGWRLSTKNPSKTVANYLLHCSGPRWFYRFESQVACPSSPHAASFNG